MPGLAETVASDSDFLGRAAHRVETAGLFWGVKLEACCLRWEPSRAFLAPGKLWVDVDSFLDFEALSDAACLEGTNKAFRCGLIVQ